MPKGNVPKREAKKPKKNAKKMAVAAMEFTSPDVEVVKKRKRKPRDEEEL